MNIVKISATEVAELKEAQDTAAAAFWAYPQADWQISFQRAWLLDRIGQPVAECPEGFLWGADDE